MKITDLTSEYIAFGGKGDIWSNTVHIAQRDFFPYTLCGKLMLSHNYANKPFEGIIRDKIGCTHCLDEYMQAMGTKPDVPGLRNVTIELSPNEIKILMLLIDQFKDDYEPTKGNIRVQGELISVDHILMLQSKLEQAAQDSISGD